MAAKRKTTRSRTNKSDGSFFLKLLTTTLLLLLGVACGYVWRSYYPLALPFESPLVSDKSSSDFMTDGSKEVLDASNDRAKKAEKQVTKLEKELESLEETLKKTERELADLKVKSMLQVQASAD